MDTQLPNFYGVNQNIRRLAATHTNLGTNLQPGKNPQPLLHPTAEDSLYMSLLLDPD
jgi:hypothetical protein